MRVRRSAARAAAEAGLGDVRRVHRQHRGWPGWAELAPWIMGFAVAEGVVAAFDWRLVLLLPVLVCAGLSCWVRLVPWRRADGVRRRFAVCDGGVLLLARGAAPVAVSWDALTTPQFGRKGSLLRLAWADGGEEREVYAGPVTAGRDLGKAVEQRRPVRARVAPRLWVAAAGAASLALAGWTVQPWLVPAVFGERPEHLRDLGRLCVSPDRPFERAAPYKGTGSHPLVLFRGNSAGPDLATGGKSGRRPAPEKVQLVACVSEAGRVSNRPIQVCMYEGGLRLESYQGRKRLDVFEARTGRRVGRVTLTGPDSVPDDCAPAKLVYGEPRPDVRQGETSPSMSEYEAALRPFVTGPRR